MALLAVALVLMIYQGSLRTKEASQAVAAQTQTATAKSSSTAPEVTALADASASVAATQSATDASGPVAKAVSLPEKETLYVLENDLIRATFTSRGGALRSVALKAYPQTQKSNTPYVLLSPDTLPFLALNFTNRADGSDLNNYRMISQSSDSIIFARTIANGVVLERRYTLTSPTKDRSAQGYLINQTLSWHNVSSSDLQLPAFSMNAGIAQLDMLDAQGKPVLKADAAHAMALDFGYYDGKDPHFVYINTFKGSAFLFWNSPARDLIEQKGLTAWASADSKFFSIICTPRKDTTATGVLTHEIVADNGSEAITGSLQFNGPLVAAGGTVAYGLQSYFGPKEYARLSTLTEHQDEVMQFAYNWWPIFAWLGAIAAFFSKLFISMLNWLAGAVHNYGVAIILLTLVIRLAMWPFTAAAAQASKKMATVQPMLKELQEKYKNSPEKLQRETVKLFQEYQVNPLAGCLPALFQIPVFLGFFYMLRSAAELRFEHFLWIQDLSMPDTVAYLGSFPVNPLPVVMLVTMYFQMKLTPSAGDPEQRKVMMLTPFLFSFLLYSFSAGLTLYWTLSNLISIIQQLLVNREKSTPSGGSPQGNVIDIKATTVK